jgi:8-oxo-dGTP diphosphatase
MARAPIQGAGGIVVRGGARPLIALVQRRKDDAWVLPKGKLKRKEEPVAAAEREVIEETGYDVSVHEFLGAISYKAGRKAKLVEFWRMQALTKTGRRPTRDIKAMQWLPLDAAIERLALPLERVFLRNVGPRALERRVPSMPVAPAPVMPVPEARGPAMPVPMTPAPTTPAPTTPVSAPDMPVVPAAVMAPDGRKGFFQRILGAFASGLIGKRANERPGEHDRG